MSKTSADRTKLEAELRAKAQAKLDEGVDAVDFSNAFFAPSGALRALWSTDAERKALADSELFKWLQEKLSDLEESEAGLLSPEASELSGRLTVVVPKSLHASLKREAKAEGISLSELIRLKLGIPYHSMLLSSRSAAAAPPNAETKPTSPAEPKRETSAKRRRTA